MATSPWTLLQGTLPQWLGGLNTAPGTPQISLFCGSGNSELLGSPEWVSLCIWASEDLKELVLSLGYFTLCNPLHNTHQKSGALGSSHHPQTLSANSGLHIAQT